MGLFNAVVPADELDGGTVDAYAHRLAAASPDSVSTAKRPAVGRPAARRPARRGGGSSQGPHRAR